MASVLKIKPANKIKWQRSIVAINFENSNSKVEKLRMLVKLVWCSYARENSKRPSFLPHPSWRIYMKHIVGSLGISGLEKHPWLLHTLPNFNYISRPGVPLPGFSFIFQPGVLLSDCHYTCNWGKFHFYW